MSGASWWPLLEERTEDALAALLEVDGVEALMLGGSIGRGEPWPLSDIDIVPLYDPRRREAAAHSVEAVHHRLVDWWAASGRAQTLDVGTLWFGSDEASYYAAEDPGAAAVLMTDRRFLHGLDKTYGGRAYPRDDRRLVGFLDWVARARFHPDVVLARGAVWRREAEAALGEARRCVSAGDATSATVAVRDAAGRLLQFVVEAVWGGRIGSLGRQATRFARMAAERGQTALGLRLLEAMGASVAECRERASTAPEWLLERIRLSWEARVLVGEDVTPQENARDNIAAFSTLVVRRVPPPYDAWTGIPDPDVAARIDRVAELFGMLAG